MTAPSLRFTSRDLDVRPDDTRRYEIIDGELYVSKPNHWYHQATCLQLAILLNSWSGQAGVGEAVLAPGLVFSDYHDVAPDVVWTITNRLEAILGEDGHLHGPPELIAEVLSQGVHNEQRDRNAKLRLYSRRGVDEYWIVDWRARIVEVFRRAGEALAPVETLSGDAVLTSSLLPGFAAPLPQVFWR
jgi:Uma2 family endonuclease